MNTVPPNKPSRTKINLGSAGNIRVRFQCDCGNAIVVSLVHGGDCKICSRQWKPEIFMVGTPAEPKITVDTAA